MDKDFKDYTVFTARILLGLIFTGAAFTKILDTASFAEIIKNYQILPEYLVNETAVFLPYLEYFTGVMLLSGIFLKGASVISLCLLTAFTGSLIFNMSRGLNVSCGCFTSVTEEVTNIHYIYYLVRDFVFIYIAFYFTKNIFSRN